MLMLTAATIVIAAKDTVVARAKDNDCDDNNNPYPAIRIVVAVISKKSHNKFASFIFNRLVKYSAKKRCLENQAPLFILSID